MAILCLAAFATAATAQASELNLEHWLDWEQARGPQISPDGDEIIYTRRRVNKFDDSWDTELWIMNADGSRHRYLADGGNVRWSPNGDRIAFTARADGKTQVFVRYMDAEGATSQITHDNAAPKTLAWSPDGRWIAFIAEVDMEPEFKVALPGKPAGAKWTEDPMVIDRLHYRMDRVGPKEGYNHLFIAPADGGAPRQLTEGKWDVGTINSGTGAVDDLQWTPDGRAILFRGVVSEDPRTEIGYRMAHINAFDIETGEIRQLTQDAGSWSNARISPNGRQIAYSGSPAMEVNYPPQQLRVMNIDGSNDRILVAELANSVGEMEWAGNGRSIYISMGVEGSTNVHNVSMSGNIRQVTEGGHRLAVSSIQGNMAAAVLSAPHISANVATINLGNGRINQVTDLNADILAGVELGDVEEIWYDSSDGARIQGWIVKPADFDPNNDYPLILSIHGGPHGMYGLNFQYRFHEFASRGYVVLYTNPRGSTGYGQAFANAIDNAYPGRRDYEDLMYGVDAILEQGYIDEDRMFVTGCSGGGVLTAWIVTQTDRFSAAASLCPVINWISFAGQADIAYWANVRFRPYFWEDPTRWLEHSPIMHVQNVTTPTLLMTGDKDLRTPLHQAEEFYSALKIRGVPTMLIPMRGEYHGTTSIPSNMLRTQQYLSKWFAEYGGAPLEDGADGEE